MADIALVIKIPEEIYEIFGYEYREESEISKYTNDIILGAFCNGIPLEDIKAEIEEQVLESLSDGGDDWFTAEKVNECLDIIDKHINGKAESEVEE